MEARLKKLEREVELQGFLLRILLIVIVVLAAAVLILWGQEGEPDFDHIAVSLTVFQTLFGLAALYGFWALRGLTKEKAEEVAEREARKLIPPLVGRAIREHLQTMEFEPISDEDIAKIVGATGSPEEEAEHGK